MTVSDQGGASPHTYNSNATTVVRDATTINYSNTQNVTVTGGNGSDTFNVTPSSTTSFNINGGDPIPPASPGDTLNVDTTGTTNPTLSSTSTPSGFQGSFTFSNRQPVNFQQIESLPQFIAPGKPWTSASSTATVDEDSQAIVSLSNFVIGLKAGQTGTVTARYNITAVQGTSTFCPATQSTVRFQFRDSDGPGVNQQVLFTIHQSNILSGGNTTIFSFDSNGSGSPPDAAFHTSIVTPGIDFDFANNIYWIEVQVKRSDPTGFADAGGIDIWESAGTPCP